MQSNPIKKCSTCGFVGSPEDFVRGRCRPCVAKQVRAWIDANKERWKAKKREWAEAHEEEMRAWYAKRYLDNRETYLANSRRNQRENHVRVAKRSNEWYHRNRKKAQVCKKRWSRNHKEQHAALRTIATRNRRARLRGDPSTHTRQQIAALLARQRNRCNSCGKDISSGVPRRSYHADQARRIK
jgi:hypothetical protein